MALARIKNGNSSCCLRKGNYISVAIHCGHQHYFLVYNALIGTTVHAASKMQTLQRHSPHSHLGFQTAKDDGLRGTARAEVGVRNQVNGKNTSGGNIRPQENHRKTSLGLIIVRGTLGAGGVTAACTAPSYTARGAKKIG